MATDDEGEHEMCFGDLGDVDDEEKIVINVGGTRHETLLTTLASKSGTRLHHIASRHTGGKSKEYFFDRHPGVFTTVMDYYRSGELHVPLDVCGAVVKRELDFWGIDEYLIKPCCWTCYSSYIDNQRALADFNRSVKKEMEELSSIQHLTGWRRKQMKIWMLLDHPRSSKVALLYAVASFVFVLASICGFCMETLPQLQVVKNVTRTCTADIVEETQISKSSPYLEYLDNVCTAFFTIELLVRVLFAPNKLTFIRSPMNLIDIAALLPLYVQIILEFTDQHSCLRTNRAVIETIFVLRIIRIFRIFHLVKHYKALKILVHAIRASIQELLMLSIFLIIAMLVFATLIFYAERPAPGSTDAELADFHTIPVGFWWAIITMTTVGYGDVYPRTPMGSIIGGLCAVWGVLLIALTIPVISNNFTLFYLHCRTRDDISRKVDEVLALPEEEGDTSPSNNTCQLEGAVDNKGTEKTLLSYAVASFIFVLASICGFCLETLPQLHYQLNVTRTCGIGNQTKTMVIHHSSPFLEHLDYICTAFFTVELVVRILFAPNKLHFFQSPMNVIDIAALLPLYVQIILELNDRQSCLRTHRAVLETIFILRIIRIFRIFHLVKHYKALKILVHAIRASIQELLMLTIFLIIAMLVFATLIFYAERPDPKTGSGNPDFETIPVGFWWAIITMTTVGYGDVFPQTAIGKLIGGMCALWGVLLVALTIPVISNNFTLFYLHARTRDLFVQGPESMRQSPPQAKEKPKDGFLANKKSKKYKMNSCKYSGETKKGFDQKALLIRVDSNSATEDGGIVMATQNSGSSIGDIKVAANNHMCKAPIANDEEDCDDNEESEI